MLFSQRSKFPALTLVVMAIAIGSVFKLSFSHVAFALFLFFGIFAILAALARLWWTFGLASLVGVIALIAYHRDVAETSVWNYDPNVVRTGAGSSLPEYARDGLSSVFDEWLSKRNAGGSKYPVFIIAAEGGGIYAAAATSLFLAKLQDDFPDFVKHVFAISAVSGGAIGATIFQALAHTNTAGMFANCDVAGAPKGLWNMKFHVSCRTITFRQSWAQ